MNLDFSHIKKYKICYIIIGVSIFLPIFLNAVLILPSPIRVSESLWLGFWGGGYLGSIVTFLSLLITIGTNKHHLMLEHERVRIDDIKEDLSRRIECLNVSESLEKPLAYFDKLDKNEQEYQLLRLSNKYDSLIHSAELRYSNSCSSPCTKDFFNKYCQCLNACKESISGYLLSLSSDNPQNGIKTISYKVLFVDTLKYKEVKAAAMALIEEHEEAFLAKANMPIQDIVLTLFTR